MRATITTASSGGSVRPALASGLQADWFRPTHDPGWESWSVAEAGASAALSGLVFVAVSINLARILAYPGLPRRAAEAIAILVNVLIASTLTLVPGQSATLLGAEWCSRS